MSVPVIHIEENVVKHKKENSSHNADLSAIFHRMASCYRYKGIEERFRALAYDKASRTLNNLKEDISVYATDVKSLDQLSGIGESIAEKIMEFLETGKIKTYEKLKKEVPQELLDLMDINGFGPATIKTLHEKLKIDNRDDLIAAIEAGKLEKLNGFGAKKIENMKRGLKLFKESHTRMLLSEAWRTGNDILDIVLKIPGINSPAASAEKKKRSAILISLQQQNEKTGKKQWPILFPSHNAAECWQAEKPKRVFY
jgi:DNA polymerase (family 10)